MSITALPAPPSRADSSTFAARGDAFMAALPTFATEANALQTDVNSKQIAAATSATNAASSASSAASSATSASTSATNAATSASTAATQAGLANTARVAAEAALDAFDDKYLGVKVSDPSLDNDGNPLQEGAFYINSVTGYIRVYVNAGWVQGISGVAGVSSFNGLTGAVTGVSSVNGSTGAVTGIATLTGTQTLTNKTLEGVVLNNGYIEETYSVSTSGSTSITLNNGSVQVFTLTGNITFTDSLSNGQSMLLGITPSAYSTTWPSITWTKVGGSGIAPTLTSSGVNWIVLWKVSGVLRASFLGTA